MTVPKTPAQRKAEAREAVWGAMECRNRNRRAVIGEAIDAYARACIDEAVAPALGMIQRLRDGDRFPSNADLDELRRLLTERAGT